MKPEYEIILFFAAACFVVGGLIWIAVHVDNLIERGTW
jgi:hypothetical protein